MCARCESVKIPMKINPFIRHGFLMINFRGWFWSSNNLATFVYLMWFDYIQEENQLSWRKLSLTKFWQNLDQTPLSFLLLYSCQKFSQLSNSKNPKFIPAKEKNVYFTSFLPFVHQARFYFTAAVKFLISVKTWKEWGGECRSPTHFSHDSIFQQEF